MTLRSTQSEGNFGNIKYNWDYARIRRRGNAGVKVEILLTCIGVNLRRLQVRLAEKRNPS